MPPDGARARIGAGTSLAPLTVPMQSTRILGSHPIVRALSRAAARLAESGDAVAIVGERGSGKELFARYLHAAAARPAERFVRIDCAENSPQRLEQALFEREGGWRRASGGSLLLDDLPQLDRELQRRLHAELAAIDRRERPQILACLDRELAQHRRDRRLCADLLDLLQPVEVVLPALRQRRADIPVLVQHFLRIYAARNDVRAPAIETEALVELWQYDWPGNVRELESVVERVVVLCSGSVIRASDLPPGIRGDTRESPGTRRRADSLPRADALHFRQSL
ncbi:sigma-54-dependent Fis family transcriptional regulator [bacterium]|nr:sigma-54-dependent Fis family transcriptional regulator [bacterium]